MFDVYIRAVVEHGNLLFPEDFCFERTVPEDDNKKSLAEISSVLGPYLYAGNYYNNPVADDLVEFKNDWFHEYKFDDVKDKLKTAKCIISVDPATKIKQNNDPTGIVVTKIDQEGFVYVLEAKAKKLLPNQLCDEIFKLVDTYGPDIVTFELVSAEILWEPLFAQEMKIRDKHFRFEKHEPGTSDSKGTKIRKLIPYYARGQVYHKPGLLDLEKQLREFPRNNNDDIIDALQAQIPYWKGTKVIQVSKLTKYTQAWWDELRARNPTQHNDAEKHLFDEYKTSKPTLRNPSW